MSTATRRKVVKSRLCVARYTRMTSMAARNVHRSTKRSYAVAFRLSSEDRAEVKRRADAAGLSMQAYLEWKALDRPDARNLPPGPVREPQEALPLTG